MLALWRPSTQALNIEQRGECNWERTTYCLLFGFTVLSTTYISKQPLHSPPSPHSHFLDFRDKPSDSSRLLVRRHGSGFASNLLKIEVRSYNSNSRHHERQLFHCFFVLIGKHVLQPFQSFYCPRIVHTITLFVFDPVLPGTFHWLHCRCHSLAMGC